MSNKLPFVSSDIPRDLRAFLDRVRELITGSGANRIVTVGDLVSSGIAAAGPGGTIAAPTTGGSTPGTPANVQASGAIQNIIVTWDAPLYKGHSHAEVWGADTDNLGDAVQLGMAPGAIFVDSVGPSVTRYYWVRFINTAGTAGAFNAVAGTMGQTGSDVAYLLDTLAGQITESELYAGLNGRIDEIDGGPGGTTGLLSKYTIKVDLAGHVAGYGVAATDNNGTPTSSFGVRADQFWVAPPSTVSATAPTSNLYVGYVWIDTSVSPNVTRYFNGSTWQTTQVKGAVPFVVQAAPTTINGVSVPAGVYIDAAYIQNGTITNAKIGDAAIDNAKIANLSASKITAGSISTGAYIQSTSFISGTQGWRISGNGTAEFGAASIRGLITAAQIDSRGLSIKDASGNTILSAGTPLSTSYISGLGSLATQSSVNWNTQIVNIPDFGNFAYLDSITSANISTYIASAAIGTAYISNLAVTTGKIADLAVSNAKLDNLAVTTAKINDLAVTTGKINDLAVSTLKIASQAVTFPQSAYTNGFTSGYGEIQVQSLTVSATGAPALLIFGAHVYSDVHENLYVKLTRNGSTVFQVGPGPDYNKKVRGEGMETATIIDNPGAGTHTYQLYVGSGSNYVSSQSRCISYLEVKR